MTRHEDSLYLISCVSSKQGNAAPAGDFYTSPWFRKARAYVERRESRWYVLSARYGLLHPEELTAPYDVTLRTMPVAQRLQWAETVWQQLEPRIHGATRVVFLAGKRYREHLIPRLEALGIAIDVPMTGLGIGQQIQWLGQDHARHGGNVAASSSYDLARFYEILTTLHRRVGGFRRLGTCGSESGWPTRGVYFFLEPGLEGMPGVAGHRVSRVGTHAVSAGSKATLWNRLSTHRGILKDGGGNHRASVFRRIVGEALLAQRGQELASWGVGNHAPRDIREREITLERSVSDYIRQISLLWVSADDTPGPRSIRADIERNAIGLLSHPSGDLAHVRPDWLGHSSPRLPVQRSGLWNNQHVGREHDPGFLDRLEHALDQWST